MKATVCFLLFTVVLVYVSNATIHRKNLAGPPEEFSLHALPEPVNAASTSLSAFLSVDFIETLQGNYLWQSPVFVDSSTYFAFTLYSPVSTKVTLVDPEMKIVELGPGIQEMTEILGSHIPTITYEIVKPTPGMYWIHLESSVAHVAARRLQQVTTVPDAYIVVMNNSPLELFSYVNTFDLVVGNQIGLVAHVVDSNDLENRFAPVKNVLAMAKLSVTYPDGRKETVPMRDDGLNGDMAEDDGVFIAIMPSTEAGYYTVQASVSGFDMNGREFARTTDHVFAVSSVDLAFSNTATIKSVSTQNMMQIDVGFTKTTSNTLRFYGELYGVDENDKITPIAWVGGLNEVTDATITLQLDTDWIVKSGVKAEGPFTLVNAFVQDVTTWSIVATATALPVTFESEDVKTSFADHVSFPRTYDHITERMRQGVRPEAFSISRPANYNETNTPLVLLHGYCSPVNPWSGSEADFTNPKFFLNAGASLGHDDYAKLVLDWSAQFGGFSSIGHSQGGIVITHTKNYYWSGLDQLQGAGRTVQAVASPFQGNTAAGSLANIGKLFGIGCGTNTDLTVTGSTLWLSGITAETRSKIFYYTATYKQSAFIDYCNAAINLIIATYNDGMAELKYTPLPGANAQGNDEPWCHSEGMKYTAVFLDHARNVKMNSLAQR